MPMFKNLLSRGLSLRIGGETVRFKTVGDFERLLDEKTKLSPAQISELLALPDQALLREGERYAQLECYFGDAIAQSQGTVQGIGERLKRFDLSVIVTDNDWRSVFEAVVDLDSAYEDFKRAALVRYTEYLSAGSRLVGTIHSHRQRAGSGGAVVAESRGSDEPQERLVFDLAAIAMEDDDAALVTRIAKGETVELRFQPHQTLALTLAQHRFYLVSGDPYLLIDEHGEDVKLRPGKNIVGRSARSDVVVDARYRAVSRKHLIVEIEEDGVTRLTDISSLGTTLSGEPGNQTLH